MLNRLNFMAHKNLVLLAFILGLSLISRSQTLELGLFGGGSYTITDVNPNQHFKNVQAAYGFVGRYYAGSRWAFRTSVTTSSADSIDRLTDVALVAEFNFFDYYTGSMRSYITPYIFGGGSYFFFSPEDSAESSPNLSMAFGLGVKYSVNKRLGLALEWRMQETMRDDLDGSSLGPNQFQSDWLNFTGVSLTYRIELSNQGACRKFKSNDNY